VWRAGTHPGTGWPSRPAGSSVRRVRSGTTASMAPAATTASTLSSGGRVCMSFAAPCERFAVPQPPLDAPSLAISAIWCALRRRTMRRSPKGASVALIFCIASSSVFTHRAACARGRREGRGVSAQGRAGADARARAEPGEAVQAWEEVCSSSTAAPTCTACSRHSLRAACSCWSVAGRAPRPAGTRAALPARAQRSQVPPCVCAPCRPACPPGSSPSQQLRRQRRWPAPHAQALGEVGAATRFGLRRSANSSALQNGKLGDTQKADGRFDSIKRSWVVFLLTVVGVVVVSG